MIMAVVNLTGSERSEQERSGRIKGMDTWDDCRAERFRGTGSDTISRLREWHGTLSRRLSGENEEELASSTGHLFGSTSLKESKKSFIPAQTEGAYSPVERAPKPEERREEIGKQLLRVHFGRQILATLKKVPPTAGQPIAAMPIGKLLGTIRAMRDVVGIDPFVEVVLALHDSLALENKWADYGADQFAGAYEVLKNLVSKNSVSETHAEKAIMELEELGFETTPFGGDEFSNDGESEEEMS
jgi:hypothetical protein